MKALQLDRGYWSGLALVGMIVACSGAAYGARIVHSPNEALAAGVNGAVDSRGAKWTVYGRSQANDGLRLGPVPGGIQAHYAQISAC